MDAVGGFPEIERAAVTLSVATMVAVEEQTPPLRYPRTRLRETTAEVLVLGDSKMIQTFQ
jgi:hypothetical protein